MIKSGVRSGSTVIAEACNRAPRKRLLGSRLVCRDSSRMIARRPATRRQSVSSATPSRLASKSYDNHTHQLFSVDKQAKDLVIESYVRSSSLFF